MKLCKKVFFVYICNILLIGVDGNMSNKKEPIQGYMLKTEKNGFLIKDIENIRKKIRLFYLYGYKAYENNVQNAKDIKHKKLIENQDINDVVDVKDSYTVRNEEAMIRNWLQQPYKKGKRSETAKKLEEIMSVDVHSERHNPLFRVWKFKSFPNQQISFYFHASDILRENGEYGVTCQDIFNEINNRFDYERITNKYIPSKIDKDEIYSLRSTQVYLKEYKELGILDSEYKDDLSYLHNATKKPHYTIAESIKIDNSHYDAISFFSEVAPCGVIGSYIMDRYTEQPEDILLFKHHYITNTLDAGVLEVLLDGIREKRSVSLYNYNNKNYNTQSGKYKIKRIELVPMKIYASAQNGRQYLMAYQLPVDENRPHNYASFRLDNLFDLKLGDVYPNYDEEKQYFNSIQGNVWGVTYKPSRGIKTVTVDMLIHKYENYVYERMVSEKRFGTVTQIGDDLYRFTANVYDVSEMIPWIRTFICRIVNFSISDPDNSWNTNFEEDLQKMYAMYGIGGEDQ